jgi:2-(1,2-epoxy-1,2-dihydrophenyl)acetyl-CoA isomerase
LTKEIKIEKKNKITIIYLNRPEHYNAFNYDLFVALGDELTKATTDDSVIGVIITGKGKAFSGGGDLKAVASYSSGMGSALHRLVPQFNRCVLEIVKMKKPVVAGINGIAAGGGFSLALVCDFRIMARSAILKQAYTTSGLSIDGGGTFILPRLVGYSRALEIAAFDEPINAEQAQNMGLVTKVVEDEKVLSEAMEIIMKLQNRSLNSFGWSKKLLNSSFSNTFEKQLEIEREGIVDCATHPDGKEGIQAFIDKRPAVFKK